jgi:4-hydroxy-3-methylbut-2-enyl diphosphate reductase
MKILLAESAGFCFGVKRAANMALEAADHYHQICSLGPLIHSPQLVKKLEDKGVKVISRVEDIEDGAVIIRSHGVTAKELGALMERDLQVVDATCPFVKKAQEYASLLGREGYTVIVVGEKEHPEIQGIISYVESGEVFVVADREEAEALPKRRRMGIVVQTTQALENFRSVVEACLTRCGELRVFNTICDATAVRQNEARTIAGQSDLVLVIGGYNSANTTRLARLCREIQPRTHHVETAAEIESQWFRDVHTVGITAGASTPRWVIDEVLQRVREIPP